MKTRMEGGAGSGASARARAEEDLPGIVIADGRRRGENALPRIVAFVWGGKVRPAPVLPFGRWKGAA